MTLAQLIAGDIKATLENSEVNLGVSETYVSDTGEPLPSHGNRIIATLATLLEGGDTNGLKDAIAPLVDEPWWPVMHPMRYSGEAIAAGATDTGRVAIWDGLRLIQSELS